MLTPREVSALLQATSGVPALMAGVLLDSVLRLMQCLRLRT